MRALKFCFKTCVAMKFVDDDYDDDDDDDERQMQDLTTAFIQVINTGTMGIDEVWRLK